MEVGLESGAVTSPLTSVAVTVRANGKLLRSRLERAPLTFPHEFAVETGRQGYACLYVVVGGSRYGDVDVAGRMWHAAFRPP
jgi:hypothetical protein